MQKKKERKRVRKEDTRKEGKGKIREMTKNREMNGKMKKKWRIFLFTQLPQKERKRRTKKTPEKE